MRNGLGGERHGYLYPLEDEKANLNESFPSVMRGALAEVAMRSD